MAVPYKLTARWFGLFVVLEAKGAQVTLDLPATFGKAHQQLNICRLKFFEARDAQFGTAVSCRALCLESTDLICRR